MLTPAKIKSHQFENSGRNAYKAESVDTFFAEVTESYEQMFRENGEMYKKIGLLAERLEEYRKDEDNIRNALLTAQRMADKITRDAQEKADSLLADAEERAKTENDRIDAISNDMLQKANYQAQAIVSDAQRQADKIIEDATASSKEAAISARDGMIKEEAALQMMKVEVTKFKQQIKDAYNEQLALIEELPEIVYAKIEEEKAAAEAEAVEEEAEEAVEDTVEETVEEAAEIIEEEEESSPADVYFTKADKAESIDVETLQEMIVETEDTDAEDEIEEESDEDEENIDESENDYILPDIDAIDEEIERLSREVAEKENAENYVEEFEDGLDEEYDDDNEYDDDEEETEETPDIPFTKPLSKKNGNGFKVNFENVSVYGDAEEVDDDEFDDDDEEKDDDKKDDGNEGGFSSKLKGFFRK